MAREIRLNAFAMNCVGHMSPGLWTHPRDRSSNYNRLEHWLDLARTLERGRFDGLFLADVLGVYDVHGGTADAALRHATQVPVNDPLLLVPAMAAVTTHLGFGVTSTLSYEPPFPFARRMSTLDHLTNGRIGWNIVTGYLDSAARAAGRERQTSHDDRYDVADDYMELVYKLWEGSWADDAVLRDRARGIFTDPAKVRRVKHDGPHFKLDAIHLAEPSPQRTPVLYQAGTSPRGRAFAGEHAECVFISGPSAKVIAPRVAALRSAIREAGRDPQDVLIFSMMTVILGSTDAEAEAKHAEYRRHVSHEGALALMSGWTGVDFSTYDLDQQIRHVESEAGRTAMDNVEPRRSRPHLDGARGRRACRHWRHRAAAGRRAGACRRWHRGLGRGDRRRRPQSLLRRAARELRGRRRPAGAGADPPRPLQERLPARHAARETVRRRAARGSRRRIRRWFIAMPERRSPRDDRSPSPPAGVRFNLVSRPPSRARSGRDICATGRHRLNLSSVRGRRQTTRGRRR